MARIKVIKKSEFLNQIEYNQERIIDKRFRDGKV